MTDQTFVIECKGFNIELKRIEINPRYDLHPNWVEFRFEMPEPMEGKHAFVMPTAFYFGPYLFEALENEPATDGWFMARKSLKEHS